MPANLDLQQGDRVRYHGSRTADHGLATLVEPCLWDCRECDDEWEARADMLVCLPPRQRDYAAIPVRWVLQLDTPAGQRLHHVRPGSFTVLEETPR